MGRYLTRDELKSFGHSQTIVDLAEYDEAIDTAEQQLDVMCKRKFVVAGAAAARVYRPAGGHTLWLDDFTVLTSIVENGVTLVEGTDFVLEPLNGLTDAGESRPYDRAIRYARNWYCDGPKATVTVTAAWGWAEIPPGAKAACKVLAKAFLDGRDIKSGLAALSESGGVSEREAKAVRDFVGLYSSHSAVAVA